MASRYTANALNPLSHWRFSDAWPITMPLLAAFLFAFLPFPAQALAGFSVSIGSINTPQVHLRDLTLQLTDAKERKDQQLALSVGHVAISAYKQEINRLDIRCHQFLQKNQAWHCGQGRAEIRLGQLKSIPLTFDIHSTPENWNATIKAPKIAATYLALLPTPSALTANQGSLYLDLSLSGPPGALSRARLNAKAKQLDLHSEDGRYASEQLSLDSQWRIQLKNHQWRWQNQTTLSSGALYAEPLFWEAGPTGLSLSSQGSWLPEQNRLELDQLQIQHGRFVRISGNASLNIQNLPVSIRSANLAIHSDDLQQLTTQYLDPFLEQSPWAGISLNGALSGHLTLTDDHLSALTLSLADFAVDDEKARFGMSGGNGIINWSGTFGSSQTSYLQWGGLKVGPIPIGGGQLNFDCRANQITLLNPADLPLLGGKLHLSQLAWQNGSQQKPQFQLAGRLSDLSLQQLSPILGWPPLSGTVSGAIPGIRYHDGRLNFEGGLNIHAFDGTITVSDLAVSGLLSDYPHLYGELSLDQLDLGQITDKFQFGGITGKLSGFVRNLHLENWHPVQFFAWFGTPDDDQSTHRISQKAVKNIASIGGAGPSDIAARSMLNFFAQFSYDKIGLGCYLNNGVCQLMGVAPYQGGYSIIQGGGLPRIDVIGYNPRVDWAVLLERLQRVTATDDVIIK